MNFNILFHSFALKVIQSFKRELSVVFYFQIEKNHISSEGRLKNPSFDKDEKNIGPRVAQTTRWFRGNNEIESIKKKRRNVIPPRKIEFY